MRSFARLCRSALVLCLLVATAGSVSAQEMPSWAAPQQMPDRVQPDESRPGPMIGPFECPDRNPNPNCIDVTPAPVDGGLALLALLGTGYAVRRLRRDSEEDQE